MRALVYLPIITKYKSPHQNTIYTYVHDTKL